MNDYTRITAACDAGILRLTLAAPPLHILDIAMMRELRHSLAAAPADTWCVVFAAQGEKAFSAGADIREHTADKVEEMLTTFHGVFEDLAERDVVSVALVRGAALGGGCELAMACDIVLAADTATFAQPEIVVGCFPPVAALLLPALVGPKKAAEMVLTGAKLSAAEAAACGLISRAVPLAELDAEGEKLLAKLATLSPSVLRLTRRALGVATGGVESFRARLRSVEDLYFRELMPMPDMSEGVAAFIAKRPPQWSGQ